MDLEARVQVMEDLEAIRRLKARYCQICDDGHNPDEMVELFAPDGIWESSGGQGVYRGHEAIHGAFTGFCETIKRSQHNVSNPIIDVRGDSASGTWHFSGWLDFGDEIPPWATARSVWALAHYEERYVKIRGRWMFQHLKAIRVAQLDASR